MTKKIKVAILYIALGRYDVFWDEFYNSAKKYFLNGIEKRFFVFTDSDRIQESNDIVKINQEKLGWPYDTMLRFKMFLTQEHELKNFDYIFFFNANMKFTEAVGEEILPEKEGLVMGLHPGFYKKRNKDFSYERNPQSTSYIPFGKGKYYVQGCLNGGKSQEYLNLCHWCNEQLNIDLENNVIPIWHDESILNKYILDKNVKILPCNYLYPEGWELKEFCKNIKIIQIDKRNPKYGGIDWLRGKDSTEEETKEENNVAKDTWNYVENQFPKKIKEECEYDEYDNFLCSLIKQAKKGQTSVELGVCPARFQSILHNKGYKLYGIDSSKLTKKLEKRAKELGFNVGEYYQNDYHEILKNKMKFDCVFSSGFVEHFVNFEEVIYLHTKLLKPGGFLLITAPNFAYGMQKFLHNRYDKKNIDRHYLPSMNPKLWNNVLRQDDTLVNIKYGYVNFMDLWYEDCKKTKLKKILTKLTMLLGKIFKGSKYFSPYCYIYAEKKLM